MTSLHASGMYPIQLHEIFLMLSSSYLIFLGTEDMKDRYWNAVHIPVFELCHLLGITTTHLLHQLPVLYIWVMQLHTAAAEMSLRASHKSASFPSALCWHILKTDTCISQGEANKSCTWHLFLFLPHRAWHEAMRQLSLLILWPCWGEGLPLWSQAPLCISQCWVRLSKNPASEGIHSLITLSLGLAALFSLHTFFYSRQANHFDSPVSPIIL